MNGPPIIFDRQSVAQHRERAAQITQSYPGILAANRAQLLDRLLDMTRSFDVALGLGCRNGEVAQALQKTHRIKNVFAADLSEAFARTAYQASIPSLACDEEWIPFGPDIFDLIVAEHCLHWINDLPGTLIQLRRCLQPDGLFLGSMFGGTTLFELRDALLVAESDVRNGVTPRVSPFVDVRDAGNLLQRAGFALPVADTDVLTIEYDDLNSLFADLRLMGETNAISGRFKGLTTQRLFEAAEAVYREKYATAEGKLMASFEIVTLTGWAPSDSQQKPLAPGSARNRLADSLGTKETEV